MTEKSKEDLCATCGHPRGVHGVGMCIGVAHAAVLGERVQVGCEHGCKLFSERITGQSR